MARRRVVRTAGIGVGLTTVLASAAATATVVLFARTIVAPPTRRAEPERVHGVDLDGGELRLRASDETRMRGRYGFAFDHERGYAQLGDVIEERGHEVVRSIISVVSGDLTRARHGRMVGTFYRAPHELGLPFERVQVSTECGLAPAWFFPAATSTSRWIIQVHGRAAERSDTLRAVPPAHEVGWNSLVVSYRNDGEAPRSSDGRYGLGSTEWPDVAAAVAFALERGASSIVLMGWSMGGAIVLQAVLRDPAVSERLVGIILESAALDWRDILRYQARMRRLPGFLGSAVASTIGAPVPALTGLADPINVGALNAAECADQLTVPILLLHSEDDGFVPIGGARRLAAARPDLVDFQVFTRARHAKLANDDPARWERLIREWLRARASDAEPV
ncbi:MAG: hypothetical protein B5766_07375 [Candidatus Lumbricidophila eiseniae]|uniref:AB hydrolase-1 domain-containing protein n=1 Tax=Candidatus Lumbricidiphila eiseniae TaxID=1969409 RepID=A0A2A6FQH7_9MICO|nr:MAG: hypothetical protein B5766_07375 [Candidatus Lumbricidophila eiseniae]